MKRFMFLAMVIVGLICWSGCNSDKEDSEDTGSDSETQITDETETDEDSETNQDTGPSIELTEVDDGRIFQRNQSNQYDLAIQGSYVGEPVAIEARIVQSESLEEVIAWTGLDDSPDQGEFAGTIANIPQGGWYKIELRFSNDESVMVTSEGKFAVGVLIACTGQSHIDYWFDLDYGAGAPMANDATRMYRHEQVLQAGPEWTGWNGVTGMGATVFANELYEALGIHIGLLDYGVQGSSLWQKNALDSSMGWWLSDDSDVHSQSGNYQVFKAGLDSIENKVEALLWIQGHTDAMQEETKENYKNGVVEIFDKFRQDTQVEDLPIIISLVTRQSFIPDENIQAIRDAEQEYCIEDENTFLGCTSIDLPLSDDTIHHSPEGQQIQASRLALAVSSIILGEAEDKYRGPQIDSWEIVDATHVDIKITHRGGTDFTPVDNIKGFEVLGSLVGELTQAVRHNENTIRLTIDGDSSTINEIRYLYGANPGDLDLLEYASQYVHDNSDFQLPLEGASVN